MRAASRTRVHLSRSRPMKAANCAGVVPSGSAPSVARRSFISRERSATIASRCRRSMVGAAVPAGASKPYHCIAS